MSRRDETTIRAKALVEILAEQGVRLARPPLDKPARQPAWALDEMEAALVALHDAENPEIGEYGVVTPGTVGSVPAGEMPDGELEDGTPVPGESASAPSRAPDEREPLLYAVTRAGSGTVLDTHHPSDLVRAKAIVARAPSALRLVPLYAEPPASPVTATGQGAESIELWRFVDPLRRSQQSAPWLWSSAPEEVRAHPDEFEVRVFHAPARATPDSGDPLADDLERIADHLSRGLLLDGAALEDAVEELLSIASTVRADYVGNTFAAPAPATGPEGDGEEPPEVEVNTWDGTADGLRALAAWAGKDPNDEPNIDWIESDRKVQNPLVGLDPLEPDAVLVKVGRWVVVPRDLRPKSDAASTSAPEGERGTLLNRGNVAAQGVRNAFDLYCADQVGREVLAEQVERLRLWARDVRDSAVSKRDPAALDRLEGETDA